MPIVGYKRNTQHFFHIFVRHCANKTSLAATTKYIFNCMEYNPYVFDASHFELVGSNHLGKFSLKVPFDHMSTGTPTTAWGSNHFFLLFSSRNFKCNPYPGSATSNNCYLKHNPQYRKTWEKYLMYIKAENSLSPQPVYTKKILDHFQLGKPCVTVIAKAHLYPASSFIVL